MIIKYKNTSIFCTDSGQGPPLILLHGFLENAAIWSPFITELSKNYRVICIDLLGHGQSGCIGYIHTMEMMAEAVRAVIEFLNLKKCSFVGHSMGGYVSLAFLEYFPDQVKSLLLVNSTSLEDNDERIQNRNRAIAAVKKDHKTFIRIAISNLFNPEHKTTFTRAIENITQEALKTPVQGIVAALEGMKLRKNRTQVIRQFEGKKVIFISKKDPVLNYDSLLNEAKIAQLKIVEFPDGHMSFIENEALFFQNLMHFIEY
ncbi:alpha/beta fold hydrolase [Aestuariivivens sediminis]|uniref:alpha/beta fold hydrolase n=1 Tax=Aestuariivivens sediminis TaxID=2913557 RepID=UPI001F56F443